MKRDDLSRFYQKFKIYIFPLVVGFSSLIMIVFIIYPQTLNLIDSQKQQEDLLTKSHFLEAKAATLENLDDSDLARKVSYVLNAYPQEPDFVNALGILQTDANQNGFGISALTVTPGSKTAGSSQNYTVKMDAIGSRNLLSRFITSIESSGRLIKVKSIEISPGRDTDSANISLEVEVLYGSIPSGLGSGADSPLPVLSSKDEELITTLAGFSTPQSTPVPSSQPAQPAQKGRANPFE